MSDLLTTFAFQSGATISDCGLYRYHLWRVWDDELPTLVFVMLNPSLADEQSDDPTIRRCIGFAKRDGFGGISVKNLFALRATDPKRLLHAVNPFGPDNESHLLACRNLCTSSRVVAAWGKIPGDETMRMRANLSIYIVRKLEPYCLGKNKDGSPKHPLYLANDTPIVTWSSR